MSPDEGALVKFQLSGAFTGDAYGRPKWGSGTAISD